MLSSNVFVARVKENLGLKSHATASLLLASAPNFVSDVLAVRVLSGESGG